MTDVLFVLTKHYVLAVIWQALNHNIFIASKLRVSYAARETARENLEKDQRNWKCQHRHTVLLFAIQCFQRIAVLNIYLKHFTSQNKITNWYHFLKKKWKWSILTWHFLLNVYAITKCPEPRNPTKNTYVLERLQLFTVIAFILTTVSVLFPRRCICVVPQHRKCSRGISGAHVVYLTCNRVSMPKRYDYL